MLWGSNEIFSSWQNFPVPLWQQNSYLKQGFIRHLHPKIKSQIVKCSIVANTLGVAIPYLVPGCVCFIYSNHFPKVKWEREGKKKKKKKLPLMLASCAYVTVSVTRFQTIHKCRWQCTALENQHLFICFSLIPHRNLPFPYPLLKITKFPLYKMMRKL